MNRVCSILLPVFLCAAAADAQEAALLTRADAVRALTRDQAEQGLPVRMQGVITFIDPTGTVFFQDETGAAFAQIGRLPVFRRLQVGQRIEAAGATFSGLFVPGFRATEARIIGPGDAVQPVTPRYDDLATGRYHYHLASVEGVARSIAAAGESMSVLRLAFDGRILEVRADVPPAGAPPVDARIRVTGLAAGDINDRRQIVTPYFRIENWDRVTMLEPPPDPGGMPLTSVNSVLVYQPEGRSGHRARVRGTVLASFPDGSLSIREEEKALLVRLASAAPHAPGETIEVLGFPQMENFSAALVDAVVLDASPGAPPEPVDAELRELMKGEHDAELVTASGTVSGWLRGETGAVFSLADGARTVRVRVSDPARTPIEDGSRAAVTGICAVLRATGEGYRSHPESVEIRTRGAADITVLAAPGWWTAKRLAAALAGVVAVLGLAMVWIFVLRRAVSRQTLALKETIEREATLRERERIAREFHDTLEQELAGLSLRLDAALALPSGEKRTQDFVQDSRRLVSRIHGEARNIIRDLRETDASPASVADLVREDAERLKTPGVPHIQIDVKTQLPMLIPSVLHHLRMIAQEAVTNAIKHAAASDIQVTLESTDGELRMAISDNGRGFPSPPDAMIAKPGHYGCMGIRERCRKIGAQASWTSANGKGTTVTIRCPLDATTLHSGAKPAGHDS